MLASDLTCVHSTDRRSSRGNSASYRYGRIQSWSFASVWRPSFLGSIPAATVLGSAGGASRVLVMASLPFGRLEATTVMEAWSPSKHKEPGFQASSWRLERQARSVAARPARND